MCLNEIGVYFLCGMKKFTDVNIPLKIHKEYELEDDGKESPKSEAYQRQFWLEQTPY